MDDLLKRAGLSGEVISRFEYIEQPAGCPPEKDKRQKPLKGRASYNAFAFAL
jgi:hypothetical protein